MKKYINYLKYILEHKKNVFIECWKDKQYIHAFTHDLSKFSPIEFIPYAEWFQGYHGVKLEKDYNHEQLNNGMSNLSRNYLECKNNFNKAWEHHYKNNPHHWDHWLDENGVPKPIPDRYLRQMLADWEAMGLKFGDTAQAYYLNNYRKIKLDRDTRMELEMMLGLNDSLAHNYGHTLEEFVVKLKENEYKQIFEFIEKWHGIDSYELLRKGK